jgi:DNA polymerase
MDTTPLGYEQVELALVRRSCEEYGVGIDRKSLNRFKVVRERQRALLQKKISELTRGELYSLDQPAVPQWIVARGCELPLTKKGNPSMKKSAVARLLKRDDLHPEARAMLELRSEWAFPSKLAGMERNIDPDTSRIFYSMTYAGAGPGRIISHAPNLQNISRETDDTSAKFKAILSGDVAKIAAFGPVLKVLADCERALVAAEPGNRFFIDDLSAIEYLVIAYLAGDQQVLDAFERFNRGEGSDPYLEFGIKCVGNVSYARNVGKGVILPCIFGVGEERLRESMLANIPELDPDTDFKRFIGLFKAQHPKIVFFWKQILRAALAARRSPGQEKKCGKLTFLFHDDFLTMRLPSGRFVSYPFARVISREGFNGEPEDVLLFKENRRKEKSDTDDVEGDDEDGEEEFLDCQSGGRPGFWGGPLAENATQAVARDVMMDAWARLETAGYRIVLAIHDELIAEVPNDFGSLEEFKRIVEQRPEWAPELPIASKARTGCRLAKIDDPVEEWIVGDWSAVPLHKVKAPKDSKARSTKPRGNGWLRDPIAIEDLYRISAVTDPLPKLPPVTCLGARLQYAAEHGWASFPAPPGKKSSYKSKEKL